MISSTKSHSIASTLALQLEKEDGSLVDKIKKKYSWVPENICVHKVPHSDVFDNVSPSIQLSSTFAPGQEKVDSSAWRIDNGYSCNVYPWTIPIKSVFQGLADGYLVGRMQSGLCAISSRSVALLKQVDRYITDQSKENKTTIFHLAVAYKTIKAELEDAFEKFGLCRDELITVVRDTPSRVTSLQAMQELYQRVEDWFGRLEDIAEFCCVSSRPLPPPPLYPTVMLKSLRNKVVPVTHYLALLSPEEEHVDQQVGIRVRQWMEDGRHLVKLENMGNYRVCLNRALFSMNDSSASKQDVDGKWVDTMVVDRFLTPYPERKRNLGDQCVPAFICFAFAPCNTKAESNNDLSDEEDDEPLLKTPTKKKREEGDSVVTQSKTERQFSSPGIDGKRKRWDNDPYKDNVMSATFKILIIDD